MTHPGLDDAREALRWQEERFRLLVESVRDYAIFLLDPEGRVTSWNAGAERIKQYKAEEILGQHFSKFYPPEEIENGRCPKCERELAGAASEGRFEDEGWRIRKDGSRFWANVVITALRDDHGRLVGFAKVTRDLTERVAAEEQRARLREEKASRAAAEEAQRFVETILQSIGDAVIATDRDGRITVMNEVAAHLTGYSVTAAKTQSLRSVFHIVNEETRRDLDNPVDRVLAEGKVIGLANHTVLVRPDGTETPIADSGAPIRDAEGNIHGVVLVFRDASQEKSEIERHRFLALATSTLASSLDYRQTLARLADLAVPQLADWCMVHVVEDGAKVPVQVALAHTDPARVAFVRELVARYPTDPDASRGAPQVIRTGRAELIREVPDDMIVRGARDAEHLRLLRQLALRSAVIVPLTTGVRVVGALTLVFADSGRHYDEDDLAFVEEVGRRAGIAIENARLYTAEQRAREMADTANRTKDEFLATVSHELRTPLTAILGWSKMLKGGALDDDKRARATETIERNAASMSQLIEDLLDVSRIVSGKLRIEVHAVDLVTVIAAALESVQPAAEAKGIAVLRELEPSAVRVLGDAARLQQVVWNLVNNAVKFTPRGGKVTVALGSDDDNATVVVADTGKGIEPRFLPYVFEPFRQGDGGIARSAGGLGLGLGISKHIVELHGGTIEAASAGPGKGATFTVRIPKAAGRAAADRGRSSGPPRDTRAPSLPQLKGLDVLVVDDEPDARALVGAVLEQCGSVVRTVGSAAEALAAIRERVPDVMVSDIGMPTESGYDLMRKIRALPADQGGNIPAAALTAYARAEDRNKALSVGFLMHVPKPVDPGDLMNVVAELARSRQPASSKP